MKSAAFKVCRTVTIPTEFFWTISFPPFFPWSRPQIAIDWVPLVC